MRGLGFKTIPNAGACAQHQRKAFAQHRRDDGRVVSLLLPCVFFNKGSLFGLASLSLTHTHAATGDAKNL